MQNYLFDDKSLDTIINLGQNQVDEWRKGVAIIWQLILCLMNNWNLPLCSISSCRCTFSSVFMQSEFINFSALKRTGWSLLNLAVKHYVDDTVSFILLILKLHFQRRCSTLTLRTLRALASAKLYI